MSNREALLDLDATTADYEEAMVEGLKKLAGPDEKDIFNRSLPHIEARMDLLRCQPGFWRNLKPYQPGFDIVKVLIENNFNLHMLTKGPTKANNAWSEKAAWCVDLIQKGILPANTTVNIVQDKSLFYGKILCDDWPPYVLPWLKHRPRGYAIVPAHPWNESIEKENRRILRYVGDKEQLQQFVSMVVATMAEDGPS